MEYTKKVFMQHIGNGVNIQHTYIKGTEGQELKNRVNAIFEAIMSEIFQK